MRYTFITGVSRGLGLALANRLSKEGSKVIGFSRNRGDFTGTYHYCDFRSPNEASQTLDQAFDSEDLDAASSIAFISNAGLLGPLDSLRKLSHSSIEENLTSNLIGSAIALKQFLEKTRSLDKPKLFVQISSGAALPERVKPAWSLYCASKAGQEQLIRAVSQEQDYELYPAKLLNFNPGVMETDMQRLIRSTPAEAFPDVEHFIQLKETGKIPDPDTVAKSLAVLIQQFDTLENGRCYSPTDFPTEL